MQQHIIDEASQASPAAKDFSSSTGSLFLMIVMVLL
jgi:hypothetical protein